MLAFSQDACKPTSFGQCFTVHARFAIYQGDGVEDLWPVGTHRLLRVTSDTKRLSNLIGDPGKYVLFGDFEVCPQEEDVPGKMRDVCIKQERNLKRVKW